jgi:phosphoribosylglycinamide formyltransferase-1
VIGVLVSGAGTNLQALIDDGLPVAAVASNKPGVTALERASRAEIPSAVFHLDDHESREERDRAMAWWLVEHGCEVVVCAGYMHLLTTAFLDLFPERVINLHPSLLPAFPGTRAIADALESGVDETGVTVHIVDEGVDTGPVLAQERVPIVPGDTVETLANRIHAAEHRLLPTAVRSYCRPGVRT